MAKLYIAYGSNLNMEQMRHRCPAAQFIGTGVIENYELQFKGSTHGAHATIARADGKAVPVGVWRIQKPDETRLDFYEGYHKTGYRYYDKEQIDVKMPDGSSLRGMVYIMDPKMDFGCPSKSYCDTIREGYRDCGLNSAVLEQAIASSMELAQHRLARDEMQML